MHYKDLIDLQSTDLWNRINKRAPFMANLRIFKEYVFIFFFVRSKGDSLCHIFSSHFLCYKNKPT